MGKLAIISSSIPVFYCVGTVEWCLQYMQLVSAINCRAGRVEVLSKTFVTLSDKYLNLNIGSITTKRKCNL